MTPQPVSRGLFGMDRQMVRSLRPTDPKFTADNAAKVLLAVPLDVYGVKERRDIYRRLLRGDADLYGRRLFQDAARADARYLGRFCNARLRGEAPTPQQGALVRGSLLRVYTALAEGRP